MSVKKASSKSVKKAQKKRIRGRYWRLIIPACAGYGHYPNWDTVRLAAAKRAIVDALGLRQLKRGLSSYLVAVQHHSGTGLPHFDCLFVYSRPVLNAPTRYDYLFKHGDLTRYRTINAAILDYGRKEDPEPFGDLDTARVIVRARVRYELYEMMEEAMLRDPFNFSCQAWLTSEGVWAEASRTNLFKTCKIVRARQSQQCRRRLLAKPGMRLITRGLIRERLSAGELRLFDSWPGYQTIVDHLNQIPRWGAERPHKTRNLLIVGPSDTGKTRLGAAIERLCATYPLGTPGGWFPEYRSGVYAMLVWDQFDLRTYRYVDLLRLLEGRPMKLPVKGGNVPRNDNQIVYMTSNLSLVQHVTRRFRCPASVAHSMSNLRARVCQVVIPPGHDLFFLAKLLVPRAV